MKSQHSQNLTDKHGNPLKGAALQSRLNSLEKQKLEQLTREYLTRNPPLCWTEIDAEEKIEVLLALDNLMTEYSISSNIQSISSNIELISSNLQTVDVKTTGTVKLEKTQIKMSELGIFQVIKTSGYVCAITGAMVLIFLLFRGGEIKEVKEAGATFGTGVALIKFCYDKEDEEK
ncbi:hypothetical protein [Laspinema olomoucense]|uniref:hypothetical protein n=1 Tax=Laspinema olomoucense TaxID=3231600 RepID=UPI0021BAE60C|nr:hypothetical protein [Laspinema sp. D3d]MCT7971135.1 hypothetical protein [Laspinema sp. D3d]